MAAHKPSPLDGIDGEILEHMTIQEIARCGGISVQAASYAMSARGLRPIRKPPVNAVRDQAICDDRRDGMTWKEIAAKYGLSSEVIAQHAARNHTYRLGEPWPIPIGPRPPMVRRLILRDLAAELDSDTAATVERQLGIRFGDLTARSRRWGYHVTEHQGQDGTTWRWATVGRPPGPRRRIKVGLRLDPDLVAAVQARAEQEGQSISDFCERLMRRALKVGAT